MLIHILQVETIGDAYMIVSGVPEKTEKHASEVAEFSMVMIEQAAHVLSPVTKEPIQVHVQY